MIDFRNKPPGYSQGIYKMPFEQYVTIPALNSSKLKGLAKSPAHFLASLDGPPPTFTAVQKRAVAIGSAFDIYICGGKADWLAIDPGWNKNSNKYKEWAKSQVGKIILAKEDFQIVVEMVKSAEKSDQFKKLFSSGHPHIVLIWQCRRTGLWCKAELDWITTSGILVDLKSTADCGVGFFRRSVYRFGYLHQLAHYLDGLTTVTGIFHNRAVWAAVETSAPYGVQVFEPSQAQLLEAESDNLDRMYQLVNCLETNNWPGYPDLIMELDSGVYKECYLWEED